MGNKLLQIFPGSGQTPERMCVCVCVCFHQMPTVILVYLLQSKMHGSVAVAAFINLSCKAQAARLSQSLTPFFLLPPSISQSKSQ